MDGLRTLKSSCLLTYVVVVSVPLLIVGKSCTGLRNSFTSECIVSSCLAVVVTFCMRLWHTHTHTHTHTEHTHTHTHTHTHRAHTHTHTHTLSHTHMHTHRSMCTHTQTNMNTHRSMCAHTHTHRHTHTNKQTCIHTDPCTHTHTPQVNYVYVHVCVYLVVGRRGGEECLMTNLCMLIVCVCTSLFKFILLFFKLSIKCRHLWLI